MQFHISVSHTALPFATHAALDHTQGSNREDFHLQLWQSGPIAPGSTALDSTIHRMSAKDHKRVLLDTVDCETQILSAVARTMSPQFSLPTEVAVPPQKFYPTYYFGPGSKTKLAEMKL
jgi:hypothetical protein